MKKQFEANEENDLKKFLCFFFSLKQKKIVISSILLVLIVTSAFFSSSSSSSSLLTASSETSLRREYLETNVTETRINAITNYLLACFDNKTGFFTSKPERQNLNEFYEVSDLPKPTDFATIQAFSALFALNKIHSINREKLIDELVTTLQEGTDGYEWYGPQTLYFFYHILENLDSIDQVPSSNWIAMLIDDYREEDGAFRSHKDGPTSIVNARNAYFLLKELNALDIVNWTKTTEYILSLQLSSGYFTDPLLMGTGLPGPSVYAYSFLNATNSLDLINSTQLREIISEIYMVNEIDAKDSAVIHYLADFTKDNGYDFLNFFENVEELLVTVKESQNPFYGGFSYTWGIDPKQEVNTFGVNVMETSYIVELFDVCKKLENLMDNITVIYPPLSLYTEIEQLNANLVSTCLYLTSICFIMIVFKKKIKFSKL